MRQPVSHMTIIALLVLIAACNWTLAATGSDSDNPPEGAPVFWGLPPAHLQALHLGPDQETLNYLLPRLTAKYRPNDAWMGVTDPRFYVLSELDNQDDDLNQNAAMMDRNEKLQKRNSKLGRNGPSLSIVQPLDVLRQRMLLEIARRKALQQVKQVAANREYLENIGKRNGLATRQAQSRNALQYDSL